MDNSIKAVADEVHQKKLELARKWGLDCSKFCWKPGDLEARPDLEKQKTVAKDSK